MELFEIKSFLDSLVMTMSQVIKLEITIINQHLVRISGTGEYYQREICHEADALEFTEDCGSRRVISTNQIFVSTDVKKDFPNLESRAERAIILHPIFLNKKLVGVVGFIALDEIQQKLLADNSQRLQKFLYELSKVISTKLMEEKISAENTIINSQIIAIFENFDCGALLLDEKCRVLQFNSQALSMLTGSTGERRPTVLKNPALCNLVFQALSMNYPTEQKILRQNGTELLARVKPIFSAQTQTKYGLLFLERVSSLREKISLVEDHAKDYSVDSIDGVSAAISHVRQQLQQVSCFDSTILISGESGTGKEVVANVIHSLSSRSDRPMIRVNCAAIPEQMFESELFGYEDGAFAGAAKGGKPGKLILADGGTLYLDEIGDIPLTVQTKLLRVIQDKMVERIGANAPEKVNIRILAATCRNLQEMVNQGKFRQDLYYSVNVIQVDLPPLRERKADIKILLNKFIKEFNKKYSRKILGVTEDAMRHMIQYDWPGNVRELQNCVEYMINFENSDFLGMSSLPKKLIDAVPTPTTSVPLKEKMQQYEQSMIRDAIMQYPQPLNEEHVSQICANLQISRASFYRKYRSLKEHQPIRAEK